MGEYCVAASTATYRLGRDKEGDFREVVGDAVAVDCRRDTAIEVRDGDWRGEAECA